MTPNTPPPPTVRKGPSRDMLGGPLLGVAVFLVIAIVLGWGLIKIFNFQIAGSTNSANEAQLDHGFDEDTIFITQRDLLLGWTSGRELVLYPSKDDLPRGTPNRRYTPTLKQYRDDPASFADIVAILEAGTRLRFTGITIDAHNTQTAVRVQALILDGPQADQQVTGLHLEEETTRAGDTRIIPRADFLQPQTTEPNPSADPDEPIQSVAPADPQNPAGDQDLMPVIQTEPDV